MANLANVLKGEIQRLARKEAKTHAMAVKKDVVQLKKTIATLRKELGALKRENSKLAKLTPTEKAPLAISSTTGKDQDNSIRPTAKTIRNLRKKFGMSQSDFASLLGVSPQSVTNWERSNGRLKLRTKAIAALAAALSMGAREAKAKLAEIQGTSVDAAKKTTKKPAKKTTKKAAKKTTKKAAKKTTKKAAKKTTKKPAKETTTP